MGFGTTVLLVFWAFFSAWFSVIDDCDEVYNYWEPVHHLLYGGGFQTWEYAPQFALRSYWYPGAMALIGYPLSFFLPKLAVFFALRLVLGLFYASCAQFFINSCPPWESSKISVFSALLTIGTCTAGSFAASTALLPNSLSMCLYMVSFGCWMRGLPAFAVIFGALGAFLGVPFSVIVLMYMATHLLWNVGVIPVLVWACIGGLLGLVPQLIIDRIFYGKWVCAVCNIVIYNGVNNDSTLYGIEPASYYVKNLLLNMNVLSVLAVLGALKAGQIVLREGFLSNPHTLSVLSAFPWLCVMFSMPHKEQRFLYPVYPLLALGAASLFRQAKRGRLLALIVIAISLLATSSRIAALENRRGTMKLWFAAQPLRNATICLGDEWYRFPSSFWLPDESVRVEFVRGGFRGLLPKHFASGSRSTSAPCSGMNDKNLEEPSRYVPMSQCDFLVEEADSSGDAKILARELILDDAATSSLSRAFFIPFVTKVHKKSYQIRSLK